MGYYSIDSADGNELSAGIQSEIVARRAAQSHADRIGKSVYLYEVGSDDEAEEIEPRDSDLLSALSAYDHGDGCLGIIIREALKNDPSATAEEIAEICREAESDAAVEREREVTP